MLNFFDRCQIFLRGAKFFWHGVKFCWYGAKFFWYGAIFFYNTVLYQGLKNDKFYWEFINTLRKVGIVTINVFLSPYSQTYKGLTAIVWMIAFLRIQIFLDPYKLKINNHWEYLSYSASWVTLFGGILFVTDVTRVQLIDVWMFIFIIIINIYFILFWMHLMLLNFNKYSWARKLSNYILMILMKKGEGHKLHYIKIFNFIRILLYLL